MPNRWIAVITRVDAKIFRERPFRRVTELHNELGRAKNREMTPGKPGIDRSRFASFKGVHAKTRDKNPHEDAAIAFAKRIAEYLRKAKATARFEEILLVAEPKMLGRVKKELDKSVLAVCDSVKRDLGHLSVTEIRGALGITSLRPS